MHRVPVFFNLKFLQGGISLALPHNTWLINYQKLINVNEGSIMSGDVDQMGMKHLPGEILKSTREIGVEFKLPERGAPGEDRREPVAGSQAPGYHKARHSASDEKVRSPVNSSVSSRTRRNSDSETL
jgi:hypothetical protein